MSKSKFWIISGALMVLATAQLQASFLIAVPALPNYVEMGMDLMVLRPRGSTLVCYSHSSEGLSIERFDRVQRRWVSMSSEEWAAYPAQKTVVVGESPGARQLYSLRPDKHTTEALDGKALHEVLNSASRELRLTKKEWERLAGKYNLELVDQNAERRRYGRYGKP